LIGVVVVVVGCAAGSYFFIERPFLSLKRRFTAKLDQG
jgi:peptidoglycan/LPS O-acetylase OafA/YrhL